MPYFHEIRAPVATGGSLALLAELNDAGVRETERERERTKTTKKKERESEKERKWWEGKKRQIS